MSNRTEAAWRKPRQSPPGGYRHCASSRLYSSSQGWSVAGKRCKPGQSLGRTSDSMVAEIGCQKAM